MDKRTVVFLAVVAAALAVLSGCPSPPPPEALEIRVSTFTNTIGTCVDQFIVGELSEPAVAATYQLMKSNDQGEMVPIAQIGYQSTRDIANPVVAVLEDKELQAAHDKWLDGRTIVELSGLIGEYWVATRTPYSTIIYTRYQARPGITFVRNTVYPSFPVFFYMASLAGLFSSDYVVPDEGGGTGPTLAPSFAVFQILDEVSAWYNVRGSLGDETVTGENDFRLAAVSCESQDLAGPVPDVEEIPESDARDEIEEENFVVGGPTIRTCSDEVPAGHVISQNPAPGTIWPFGAAINLVVSTGPCEEPEPDQFKLIIQVSPTAGGTTTPAPGVYYYDAGEVVNLSAEPFPGYRFVRWDGQVAGEPEESFNTAIMDGDKTVTAVFEAVGGEGEGEGEGECPELELSFTTQGGRTEFEVGDTVVFLLGFGQSTDDINVRLQTSDAYIDFVYYEDGSIVVEHRVDPDESFEKPTMLNDGRVQVLKKVVSVVGSEDDLVRVRVSDECGQVAEASLRLTVVQPEPEQATVPGIVGLQQAAANTALTGAGLIPGTVNQVFSSRPVGEVLSQSPVAGTQVSLGSAVNYTVSKGTEQATVPSIVGLQRNIANNNLTAVGLTTGTVTEVFSSRPVGEVLSQSPVAGTQVPLGSAVNYTVSKGEEPDPEPLRIEVATVDSVHRLVEGNLHYYIGEFAQFELKVVNGTPPFTVVAQAPDSSRIEFVLSADGSVEVVLNKLSREKQQRLDVGENKQTVGTDWQVHVQPADPRIVTLVKECESGIELADGPHRFSAEDDDERATTSLLVVVE